jgi:hypothetical protein
VCRSACPAGHTPARRGAAGVDLGEIHLAVVPGGRGTTIFTGRALRAKRQYQNKLKATLAAKQACLKKGSRRSWKLQRSKQKQLGKLDHEIREILPKETTALLSTLHVSGVQMVNLGDVRDLRQRVDYGPAANQRIHQMMKAKSAGWSPRRRVVGDAGGAPGRSLHLAGVPRLRTSTQELGSRLRLSGLRVSVPQRWRWGGQHKAQVSGLRPSRWGDGVPHGHAVAPPQASPRSSR